MNTNTTHPTEHGILTTYEQAESIIDAYQSLRTQCYKAARRNDGALMGNDAWLRSAMSENDLELSPGTTGIYCYGRTFTTQTMDYEDFGFDIPFEALIEGDA